MSKKKDDLNKPTAIESGKPLTPVRTDGNTSTVIVAEEAEPGAVKTAAMPAWQEDGAPLQLNTQPTPAWPITDTGKPALTAGSTDRQPALAVTTDKERPALNRSLTPDPGVPVTQQTPAWDEEAAKPLVTEPTPAWEDVAEVKTRGVPALKPDDAVNQATKVKLAQVSNDEVGQAMTRPTRRNSIPRPVLLGLAGLTTLSVVLLAWLFARSGPEVKDPSRLEKIPGLPAMAKKAGPAPLPEKRADVTDVIAKPKEPPRPALTTELLLDAGAGLQPESKTVPASIVRIDTEPPVSITWNGVDYGWTPALITMPVGQHTVSIENKDVGLKRSLTVNASNEERTFLRFEFAKGWLSIDRPKTAKVSVAGVPVKDRAILLWEGRHRIDVVFGNGQKTSKTADVVSGVTAEVFFDDPLPQE
ncbi:MAG: hypothetical protein JNJ54_34155 [Myxococcaceae bacterium]|nr:hypothetical protein [Myxococcaceae bacterium]